MDDLLAQKLKVLLQRVETKDYVDIAELLHAGLSLIDGLAGARALFHNTFSPAIAVATLSYFEGIDTTRFLPHRLTTLQQATKKLITQDSLYLPERTIRSHYLTDDELSQRLPVQKQLQFIKSLLNKDGADAYQRVVAALTAASLQTQLHIAEQVLTAQDRGLPLDPKQL